jgi:mannitol-specific phosphotransferase system IIBC component
MPKSIKASDVSTIIFVCEAGIGSSLMSVNALKKKLKQAKVDRVSVVHSASSRLPTDAKVVICHKGMAKMARTRAPEAVVIGFNFFFNDPVFDKVVKALADNTELVEEG